MKFGVEFSGKEAMEGYLNLPSDLRKKLAYAMDLLAEFGFDIPAKYSKAFGDGLFELRAEAKSGIARAFYTFESGRIVVILNVFVKKSQKTPKLELERARKLLKELRNEAS